MRILLLPLLLAACDGTLGDDGSDTAGDTSGMIDTGEDTEPVDHGSVTITGIVDVQLYTEGVDEDITEVAWADYGDTFPFGAIFVAAYTLDETTNLTTYYDQYVIAAPTPGGDAYELTVDADDAAEVRVYAALDWWPDGVIGTTEPIGIYADLVPVTEDTTVSDVDITIQAPLFDEGGNGGLGGGGSGGTPVTLSGDVDITTPYAGGDGKALIYDTSGVGPYYVSSFTPTATADGAESTYTIEVGADIGAVRLLGAWDSNINGLIEPTDHWGAYVVGGENANPVTVGSADQAGLTIEIPYGLPPELSPFVRLEGGVRYDADFSTLPAGTTVYVAALRTRPSEDFGVADLGRGYDWVSFTGAELTGTSLDYTMVAPSNAIAYVWAYADTDGDGLLNEAGEMVASVGRSGRISTGTSNSGGLDMAMTSVVE